MVAGESRGPRRDTATGPGGSRRARSPEPGRRESFGSGGRPSGEREDRRKDDENEHARQQEEEDPREERPSACRERAHRLCDEGGPRFVARGFRLTKPHICSIFCGPRRRDGRVAVLHALGLCHVLAGLCRAPRALQLLLPRRRLRPGGPRGACRRAGPLRARRHRSRGPLRGRPFRRGRRGGRAPSGHRRGGGAGRCPRPGSPRAGDPGTPPGVPRSRSAACCRPCRCPGTGCRFGLSRSGTASRATARRSGRTSAASGQRSAAPTSSCSPVMTPGIAASAGSSRGPTSPGARRLHESRRRSSPSTRRASWRSRDVATASWRGGSWPATARVPARWRRATPGSSGGRAVPRGRPPREVSPGRASSWSSPTTSCPATTGSWRRRPGLPGSWACRSSSRMTSATPARRTVSSTTCSRPSATAAPSRRSPSSGRRAASTT